MNKFGIFIGTVSATMLLGATAHAQSLSKGIMGAVEVLDHAPTTKSPSFNNSYSMPHMEFENNTKDDLYLLIHTDRGYIGVKLKKGGSGSAHKKLRMDPVAITDPSASLGRCIYSIKAYIHQYSPIPWSEEPDAAKFYGADFVRRDNSISKKPPPYEWWVFMQKVNAATIQGPWCAEELHSGYYAWKAIVRKDYTFEVVQRDKGQQLW